MPKITSEQIEKLRELSRVTNRLPWQAGPWRVETLDCECCAVVYPNEGHEKRYEDNDFGYKLGEDGIVVMAPAIAEFIVEMRNTIDALLDEIEAGRAE